MSACQQFKQAFLQQCARDGLSLSETHERVKAALSLTDLTLLPVAAGLATGAGVAKVQGLLGSDEDPDELKNRELIDAMGRAAAQARLRNRISTRHQQVMPSRPLLR